MPNYCYNILRITGDKVLRDKFEEKASSLAATTKDSDGVTHTTYPIISFEAFLPTPPNLLKGEGWYDWRIANWGTKWDACSPQKNPLGDDPDSLVYSFDTAWAPPETWLRTVSAQFPTLTFILAFSEEGNELYGQITIKNEEMLESVELTHEEFLEAHDEVYRDEKEMCLTDSLEELVDTMTEGDGLSYDLNEIVLLNRLKDEDLEMFKEAKWNNPNIEEEYQERVELYKIKRTPSKDRPLLIGTLSTPKATNKLESLFRKPQTRRKIVHMDDKSPSN